MAYRVHHLKISREYADSVLNGDKTFEVRLNDRAYQKGDQIQFSVVDPHRNKQEMDEHDLSGEYYEITYVLSGVDGLDPHYVVLGIKPCENRRIGMGDDVTEAVVVGFKTFNYRGEAVSIFDAGVGNFQSGGEVHDVERGDVIHIKDKLWLWTGDEWFYSPDGDLPFSPRRWYVAYADDLPTRE